MSVIYTLNNLGYIERTSHRLLVKYRHGSIFPHPASQPFEHIPSYFSQCSISLLWRQFPTASSANTHFSILCHSPSVHLGRNITLLAPRPSYLEFSYLICPHGLLHRYDLAQTLLALRLGFFLLHHRWHSIVQNLKEGFAHGA